jgi:hypothetical protein
MPHTTNAAWRRQQQAKVAATMARQAMRDRIERERSLGIHQVYTFDLDRDDSDRLDY